MSGKNEEKDGDKEASDWKDALGFFAMRVCDSAYLPWALVALFCFGIVWVLTRNLESKDALAFLWSIGSLSGLAWAGWVIAPLEVPIARWALSKSVQERDKEIERLKDENVKARKLLTKGKQAQLDLQLEKPEEKG